MIEGVAAESVFQVVDSVGGYSDADEVSEEERFGAEGAGQAEGVGDGLSGEVGAVVFEVEQGLQFESFGGH